MATAKEIGTDALESLQVYAPGDIILDADLARCFNVLNDMLDSWSNEALTTFANLEQSTTLVPGQYQYSIGVGAPLDMQRPLTLTQGYGAAYILDQTGNRYPLTVIEQDVWNQLGNILTVNANIPIYLFYDPQFPWGILNIYPIPNTAYVLYWDSRIQFTSFQNLTQDSNLPPGYVMALKRNLALEIAPYYPTAVLSPRLQRAAEDSKANVKRTNFRPTVMQYESEIVSKSRSTYNIYRDTGA